MTDSEKLDLLLAEMQEMKTEMKDMKTEIKDMKTEMKDIRKETNMKLQEIDKRLSNLETGQAELKKRVDKLAVEHAKTQGGIFKINRKIENTYEVALDALAATAENRKWLETGTSTLI